MTTSLTPYQAGERYHLPDLLRGFALFGILVVNMNMFMAPFAYYLAPGDHWPGLANQVSHSAIRFFFEGKFYTIFSLLFGMGFYLFLKKAEQASEVLGVFRKRLFFLLLFGAMHVLLLWYGDILVFYALIGFIMLLFRKCSNRCLLIWAGVFISIPILFTGFMLLIVQLVQMSPTGQEMMAQQTAEQMQYFADLGNRAMEIYTSGSFMEIIQIRLEEYKMTLMGLLVFYPNVLAMFLVGLVVARKGYLTTEVMNTRFFKKALIWGLVVGIPANALYAWKSLVADPSVPSMDSFLAVLGSGLGGISFAMVYIGIWGSIFRKGWMKRCTGFLSNTGRMALTVYLGESIICTTLFYSYGFRLYGTISIWEGLLFSVAIYTLLAFLAQFMVKKLHYGPAEWLWRTLTYGKRQAFLKHPDKVSS